MIHGETFWILVNCMVQDALTYMAKLVWGDVKEAGKRQFFQNAFSRYTYTYSFVRDVE